MLLIIVAGFLLGEAANRLGFPRLIGMFAAGVILGPRVLDALPAVVLEISEQARMFALIVILLKAGLGLDKEKILSQGSVALRLGFMPAVIEAFVVAVSARLIFGWDWIISWLLAWIVCAASPAVIVPMMLKLKSEGWGVKKGIPDLILAGGTMSDVTAITMFGITLAWAVDGIEGGILSNLWTVPVQIIAGAGLGYLAGKLCRFLIHNTPLSKGIVHDIILAVGIAAALVLGGNVFPYSGFLSVMVMGFTLLESDRVIARRVRNELDKVWVLAEILLFVYLGAAVDLNVVSSAGGRGLLVIGLGLVIGRWAGIFASTWRSRIELRERTFMVVGDMAKATVQAALGAIPLSMGVPHGEVILAISALSILLTAPLGAFGTVFLAPKMLKKGRIDFTRVHVDRKYVFLAALDDSEVSEKVLREASAMARQVNGRMILLHVPDVQRGEPESSAPFSKVSEFAVDIEHEIFKKEGNPAELILETAEEHGADFIFIGKSNKKSLAEKILGSVSKQVLENAGVPVIVVD